MAAIAPSEPTATMPQGFSWKCQLHFLRTFVINCWSSDIICLIYLANLKMGTFTEIIDKPCLLIPFVSLVFSFYLFECNLFTGAIQFLTKRMGQDKNCGAVVLLVVVPVPWFLGTTQFSQEFKGTTQFFYSF